MTRGWKVLAAAALLVAAGSILFNVVLYVRGGNEGRKARETQCDREPVQRKIAQAAYDVRSNLPRKTRITAQELQRFLAQAPEGCPPPTK